AAAEGRAHRRFHPPAALRSQTGLGLDHRRRLARDRRAARLSARDGLLRAHPPGAPPPDGPHRASRGAVLDVPPAGAGIAAEARAGAVGSRASRQGPGAARRRHRSAAALVQPSRDPAGGGGLTMRFAALLLALLAAAEN